MRRHRGREQRAGAAPCSSSWRVWSRAFGWLKRGPWRRHLQRTPTSTPSWCSLHARDVSVPLIVSRHVCGCVVCIRGHGVWARDNWCSSDVQLCSCGLARGRVDAWTRGLRAPALSPASRGSAPSPRARRALLIPRKRGNGKVTPPRGRGARPAARAGLGAGRGLGASDRRPGRPTSYPHLATPRAPGPAPRAAYGPTAYRAHHARPPAPRQEAGPRCRTPHRAHTDITQCSPPRPAARGPPITGPGI